MEETIKKSGRKAEIVLEGAKIIREKGFAGATMRDLAQAVNLEVSSLYNHIKSKQDILTTICFDIADEYSAGLNQILSEKISLKKALKRLITLHISLAEKHKDAMHVFEDEWKHLQEDDLIRFKALRNDYEDRLLLFFTQGIEKSKFTKTDPKTALYTLLSSLRWLNHYFKDHKTIDVQKLSDEVTLLITKGLLK